MKPLKCNFFRPGEDVAVNAQGGPTSGRVVSNAEEDGRFGYIVQIGGETEPRFVPVKDVDRPRNGDPR